MRPLAKANARKTSQVNAGREATEPNGKSKTHDTSNRLRRIQNDGIRVWAVNQLLRVEVSKLLTQIQDAKPKLSSVNSMAEASWRREWDSNPRYPLRYTRFPSVRLQPLGHLSVRGETCGCFYSTGFGAWGDLYRLEPANDTVHAPDSESRCA